MLLRADAVRAARFPSLSGRRPDPQRSMHDSKLTFQHGSVFSEQVRVWILLARPAIPEQQSLQLLPRPELVPDSSPQVSVPPRAETTSASSRRCESSRARNCPEATLSPTLTSNSEINGGSITEGALICSTSLMGSIRPSAPMPNSGGGADEFDSVTWFPARNRFLAAKTVPAAIRSRTKMVSSVRMVVLGTNTNDLTGEYYRTKRYSLV